MLRIKGGMCHFLVTINGAKIAIFEANGIYYQLSVLQELYRHVGPTPFIKKPV